MAKVNLKTSVKLTVTKAQQKKDIAQAANFRDALISNATEIKKVQAEFITTIGHYLVADTSQLVVLDSILNTVLAKAHTESGSKMHSIVKKSFKNAIDNATEDDIKSETGKGTKANGIGYTGPQMALVVDKSLPTDSSLKNEKGKGYKPLTVALRGSKEEKGFDPFKHLVGAFDVCLKKLDNGTSRDLSKDELVTVADLLEKLNAHQTSLQILAEIKREKAA